MTDRSSAPYLFDEFFASGREESISPFLTPSSRTWGKSLSLKSALAAAILLALAFVTSFFYSPISNLFLIATYFLAGTPALIGALEDLKNLEINIDVLMTMAALLSVAIGSAMEGALLLVLFELSAALEQMVTQKTKGALLTLNRLVPKVASVVGEGGILYERSVKEIELGTNLLVKAGAIVPLDGKVIDGSSFVNLVHLTGESQPVAKKPGDEIQAGAYNLDGFLTITVTKTYRESTLSRIIQLIAQAQEAKPKLQRFLDVFGKWYAMAIILLAAAFAGLLPIIFSIDYFGPEGGIYRALTFLIAASPCALIIATPTAYLSAISSCARKGILLKGGVVLDALAKCNIIAFDKTGTLTTGALTCSSIEALSPTQPVCDVQMALAIAAALERGADHPIGKAICNYATAQGAVPISIVEFKATAGRGLEALALLNGEHVPVCIGQPDFIASKIPKPMAAKKDLKDQIEKTGQLNTLLLVQDSIFAFHFIDSLRPQTFAMVQKMKEHPNLRLMILTGDHSASAQMVAGQLGIEEVFANLRPEDKLAKVAQLSQENGLVMVGDGINDAPALARATVGISMGKIGSATAVDASDVVFLKDDLSLLDWLKRKAHQTVTIVKENLILAMAVILLATTPALLGLVPLWVAVVLHEGGTVLVGLNSLRLLRS